jgi:hypothetical protein
MDVNTLPSVELDDPIEDLDFGAETTFDLIGSYYHLQWFMVNSFCQVCNPMWSSTHGTYGLNICQRSSAWMTSNLERKI